MWRTILLAGAPPVVSALLGGILACSLVAAPLLFSTPIATIEAQGVPTPIRLTPVILPPEPSLLRINDATIREPVRGTRLLFFTVSVTPVAAEDVTVAYIFVNGSAQSDAAFPGGGSCGTPEGADFIFRTSTLRIPAGQSSGSIPVTICGDQRVEPPETFTVALSNPSSNARIARGVGVGTILDAIITATTGTFELSPQQAIVAVGEPLTYRFAWTVPEDRVWRDLNTLDLRVRPDSEALEPGIWVRWDEASDTLSLCQAADPEAVDDASSGQCGAGMPAGSSGALDSEGATLVVVDTVAEGSGPTGPTVTLTISLSLTEAGRYLVEVAGDDDFGNRDGFFPVGNLQVGEPATEE